MKKEFRTKRRFLKRVPLLIVVLVFTAFLTWFLVRFFTLETKLESFDSFEAPKSASLRKLTNVGLETFAVALDDKVIAGGSLQEEVRPTASTAKMILGLAIMKTKPFEFGEKGETITITSEFYQKYLWYRNHGGSYAAVYAGEEISQYDALAAVFLPSSNNMADSLAIWGFGSLENYREYATKMLNEWGIHNTVIGEDASGFSETTVSTAADLARIGSRVLENPVLREIVGTKQYKIPVAGTIRNTNKILGENGVNGIKTGFIGDASGYCLVSSYSEDDHDIVITLLNATTREQSFNKSLILINDLKDILRKQKVVASGDIVGYYDSWWTGLVAIRAERDLDEIFYEEAAISSELVMSGIEGELILTINDRVFRVPVKADDFKDKPSFIERVKHMFGWSAPRENAPINQNNDDAKETSKEERSPIEEIIQEASGFTKATSNNCTTRYGKLMLINPNFKVEKDFISARRGELVSISSLYGIKEGNPYNGDNLLDAEAATHINEMVRAYEAEYPGHTLETRSCFRAVGTTCGRMCAATGTSDHHTGLTCDLLDPAYGTALDTDHYNRHLDWQWLRANSYKYGFIDRFPVAWAGGPMSAPINVDENGTTGLFETWHYRYVGVPAATEIATGVYNNGEYDSLEHYLKAKGLVSDLKNAKCE